MTTKGRAEESMYARKYKAQVSADTKSEPFP